MRASNAGLLARVDVRLITSRQGADTPREVGCGHAAGVTDQIQALGAPRGGRATAQARSDLTRLAASLTRASVYVTTEEAPVLASRVRCPVLAVAARGLRPDSMSKSGKQRGGH